MKYVPFVCLLFACFGHTMYASEVLGQEKCEVSTMRYKLCNLHLAVENNNPYIVKQLLNSTLMKDEYIGIK